MNYPPEAYAKLDAESFDAIVTGELVHQALHVEQVLVSIICDHFCREGVENDFRRLLLYRDGLSFQDKIEIVRALLPTLRPTDLASQLKTALQQAEELKSLRNAFAHGLDVVGIPGDDLEIKIEIVGRSGKEKRISVTPTSHCQTMLQAEELVAKLRFIAKNLVRESAERE
jgi:hypothetical protein